MIRVDRPPRHGECLALTAPVAAKRAPLVFVDAADSCATVAQN